jgi:hypothetical protein
MKAVERRCAGLDVLGTVLVFENDVSWLIPDPTVNDSKSLFLWTGLLDLFDICVELWEFSVSVSSTPSIGAAADSPGSTSAAGSDSSREGAGPPSLTPSIDTVVLWLSISGTLCSWARVSRLEARAASFRSCSNVSPEQYCPNSDPMLTSNFSSDQTLQGIRRLVDLLSLSHSKGLTVHGHTSLGLKSVTRWQSSGYDECREYGKWMIFGSLLIRASFLSLFCPLTERDRLKMDLMALARVVSLSSPNGENSTSRPTPRPLEALSRRKVSILDFSSSDMLSLSASLEHVSRAH